MGVYTIVTSGVPCIQKLVKKFEREEMNDISVYRKELSEFSRRAFYRGLVGGTGGNLSVRVRDTNTVLVTPSGISLGDVVPEENILVNLEGEILESSKGLRPSKETGFHLAAYQLRPDVGAIAHVHPPYATAYSNKMAPLPLATVSARVNLKHVPCIECFLPGSSELRESVIEGIKKNPDSPCILMKEHGILAMGRDLKHAYYIADLTEDTAKIAYIEATIPPKP
ncbi:MAG: class II aldolase/adducin family protein [Deltaproteobacteria bacterium]|nr:class II aldolase/adducin family protein [Deltaproteobacteria bacterium]MBW1977433.1 class II aldolase/adducin family protein [Deltaproteobacteria bacterium]MBW2044541.1 class II aldolase/adducin family protein [Deltaproteobacteria bacterium]MBW2300013.1 class II aldolase/adducin family protein [Deltaproteobacteria bacterium]